MDFFAAIESGRYEQVMALNHPPVGLCGFMVIHSTSLGPAFGGIRFWSYATPKDGLRDCLRLAQGMTYKCALAGVEAGGGNVVLLEEEGMDRSATLKLLGKFLEGMGGRIISGPDLGTSLDDLEEVSHSTKYVIPPSMVGPTELGMATAIGVLEAMRATSRVLGHDGSLAGMTVAIQGVGAVGSQLARLLHQERASLILADVNQKNVERLGQELGAQIEDPGVLLERECDFLAPCARGGVIHDLSIERLNCRAVVGSANNQLATADHGLQLHHRGILYGPDFMVNAGGLIQASSWYLHGKAPDPQALGRIGLEVEELLRKSRERDIPPAELAEVEAERRIREKDGKVFFAS